MTADPNEIRREIERTRANLSNDVDALAYKVSPGRIVDDRKQRARGAVRRVKDRIMGSAEHAGHTTHEAASSLHGRTSSAASTVREHASSAVSSVGHAAHEAPAVLREKSEGNPLAAGLIAFGLGWLVSSLLPETRHERQVAQQVREKAGEHADTVKQELGNLASEARQELREPVRHAADSVRSTAAEGVRAVRDDG
ncbi:MAG TPA: DUF3618 domain-containing protein, partial [Micromonospora sp.]